MAALSAIGSNLGGAQPQHPNPKPAGAVSAAVNFLPTPKARKGLGDGRKETRGLEARCPPERAQRRSRRTRGVSYRSAQWTALLPDGVDRRYAIGAPNLQVWQSHKTL